MKSVWYIAVESERLGKRPIRREINGTPLVLFRDRSGEVLALLDRCAHRNVPLSLGRVVEDTIECAYHGWRFGGGGDCQHIPMLCGAPEGKGRRVEAYEVREQQGHVWVYMDPGKTPTHSPYRFPYLDERGYSSTAYSYDFQATIPATLENILDVPHTAFLHRGLFRTGQGNHKITAVVRRFEDRVEAEFLGEPRPTGVMGRLLAPGGGTVEHKDRFILPSIAEVDYRLGESHLCISSVLTPVSEFATRMFAVASIRLPLPMGGPLLTRLLTPFVMRVLKQDADMLLEQTRGIQNFGGERFVSTDVDLLGPHIVRLLRAAERGEAVPASVPIPVGKEKRITMLV